MGSVPVPAWSRRAWCWCVWRPGEVHSFCRVFSHAILILLHRKGSIALCGDEGWAPVSAAVLGWSLALSGTLLQQPSGSALLLCLGICKIPSKSLALRPSQTWAKGRVKTTFLEHMTKLKILAKNKFPFLHMSQDFLSSSLFTYKGNFLMPSVVLFAFCSCLFKFDWTRLLWSQTSWHVFIPSPSPLRPVLLRGIAVLGWEPQPRPTVLGGWDCYRNSLSAIQLCKAFSFIQWSRAAANALPFRSLATMWGVNAEE